MTPLSLGVETLGGVMTKLIERNTTIPTKKTEVFSTAADNQPSVEIHVLQGEREMAKDNRTLGKFHLVGIPPAPRGVPQVEVTFDIDANGILNVSAKDRATSKTQNITITSSSGLNKDEVEKMVKEAQAHAEEDKKRREMVDLRNQADSLAYNLEKLLSDNSDKIDAAQAKEIEDAVAETRKAMEGEDADALKKAVERVTSRQPPGGGVPLQGLRRAGAVRGADRPVPPRPVARPVKPRASPTTWSTRSTPSRSNAPHAAAPPARRGRLERQEQQRYGKKPGKVPAKSGQKSRSAQSGRSRRPTAGGARVPGTQRRLALRQWRQARHGESKTAPRPRAGQADRGAGAEGRRDHRARHREGEAAAGGGRRRRLRARARERPARAAGGQGGDKVLVGKWSGTEVKLDGTEYLIVKEDEILGILG